MATARPPKTVIVGCGFGGAAAAIALKRAGIDDFLVLERADDVGGVWRDNTYPGASCDIASRLYSYSHVQDWDWSTAYAPQPEILAYIKHCIAKYNIAPHIRLDTEVTSAVFDAARHLWALTTRDGRLFEANVLVSAVGVFSQPKIPAVPGQADFKGEQFHSARWKHAFSLVGKRIAVIGNGASAVQFLPHVARTAKQVYLFQRTPQWVMPRGVFPGSNKLDDFLRNSRFLRRLGRFKVFLAYERRILRRLLGRQSGLRAEGAVRDYLKRSVANEQLRNSLVPDFPLGCRRPLGSDDWLHALQRSNVELVTAPISQILANGIRTTDNRVHDVDVIIYGTGFTSTAYLSSLQVTGSDRQELAEAWKEAAEAYLGMAVPGFPNLFLVYGPNTNAPNVLFMLECQARYIAQCVKLVDRNQVRTLAVRPQVHRRYVDSLMRRLSKTDIAADNCSSNFKQKNGRITVAWPGTASEYMWRTRNVKLQDYEVTY